MSTLGSPLTRVDGPLKVTGKAEYAAEFKVPNVAHAVIVESTVPKGRITSIDTRRAKTSPVCLPS